MNETSSDSSSDCNVDVSDNDCGPTQIVCQVSNFILYHYLIICVLLFLYFWYHYVCVLFKVHIKASTGLPPSLSNFVFCQYNFWGHPNPVVVAPIVNPEYPATRKGKESMAFKFDHMKVGGLIFSELFKLF